MLDRIKDLKKVEDVELDLPEVLLPGFLSEVQRTLFPSTKPRMACEGHRSYVLHVSSHLIQIVEPPEPRRSLAEPRMNWTGRVNIAAREDLVTVAQVIESLVQESPVLQGLSRKLAGLGVEEFFFNPPQIVGSVFSSVDVGVVARIQNSCPSPIVLDKQIENTGLLLFFLIGNFHATTLDEFRTLLLPHSSNALQSESAHSLAQMTID
jgi:hypothetical protein